MAVSLQQIQTQKMLLTPEQIQVIKMLELPTTELQQRINEELQENPVLELGEDLDKPDASEEENDYSLDDDMADVFGEEQDNDALQNEDFDYSTYTDDDEPDDYYDGYGARQQDDDMPESPVVAENDFYDYLRTQAGEQRLTEQQRQIVEYIIGNIDGRGYLTRTPEQMVDDLAFHVGIDISDEEMLHLVDIVRHFDPIGVGAYNLKDCLLMQLNAKKKTDAVRHAITFIEKDFTEVGKHHYSRLQKKYNITEEEVKAAINEITTLTPTPSSSFGGNIYEVQRSHIIPDFRVETYNDEIVVSLCDEDIPALHVSEDYQDMLAKMQNTKGKKSKTDRDGIRFLKQKIDSAKWFIDAIRQRNETLLNTMKAIVAFQRDYFIEGDDSFLKPMILDDIAKVTGYDPSTISRVSNSKYVLTDFGIIPLKHFFSESLTTDQGDEVSTREVKKILKDVISAEDKRHPLTDEQLVTLLAKDGYVVARRTISKYREQLGIRVARLRKKA
ncbi:MAG: RNA polymerase factor sigma-54 [Paludibacteraceae bacterium]|nr:RNA polymerase factor sigma-54 [Paludibacteraceae bacterium]